MAVEYRYGAEEVQAKAAQAGKAQAAKVQLQQQFQKDMAMMDYGFRIQAEQRARAWELEKMEIASRMDFQQQERLRLQENESYQNALEEIDKRRISRGGTVPDEIADKAKLDTSLKHFNADGAAEFLGAYEAEQEMMGLRKRELDLRQQDIELRGQQIGMAGIEAEADSQALENYLRMVQESNLPEEKKQGLIMQAAGKQAGISAPSGLLTPPTARTTDPIVRNRKILEGFVGAIGKDLDYAELYERAEEVTRPIGIDLDAVLEEMAAEEGFAQEAEVPMEPIAVNSPEELEVLRKNYPKGTPIVYNGRVGELR